MTIHTSHSAADANWLTELIRLPQTEQLQSVLLQTDHRLSALETDQAALLDILFLKAIRQKLEGREAAYHHIYLEQFEIPQIVLFDILIHKMPFVVQGHRIANQCIADTLINVEQAVLIDAGIGRGLQTAGLIRLLEQNTSLKELVIIGIEPFNEAVIVAKELIGSLAEQVPFRITFTVIESLIEDMDAEQLKELIPSGYETLTVNSAFTLHHIRQREKRRAFFSLMKELKADHIMLLEPHSDHFTDDWEQRVLNAYEHYGTVFRVIDQLDISEEEKKGLKIFFGREIDDVVGFPDDQRFERHEPGDKWVEYLDHTGFGIVPFKNIPPDLQQPSIRFSQSPNGYLQMEHDGVSILSIINAVAGFNQ